MRLIFSFVLVLALLSIGQAQCVVDPLVIVNTIFFDDFDSFDPNEWEKNTQCQLIQHDPNLVSYADGNLVLSTNKGTEINSCGNVWSAGAINSTVHYPRTPGVNYMIFEISAKMPVGKHTFPAFWLYSLCNEVDIFEYHHNMERGKYFTNGVHEYVLGCDEEPSCYRIWTKEGLDTEFHTYSVAWRHKQSESDVVQVTFFFDGKELWTQDYYQLQVNGGVKIRLGTGVDSWSNEDNPTPLLVDYVKVLETNTTSLSILKKEYYNSITGSQVCESPLFSMNSLEDNQLVFNSGGWMHTFYYSNDQWNVGYITQFLPEEQMSGEIHSNNDRVYYRGADNKLHYYYYDNGWNHVKINSTNDVSGYSGIIATHYYGDEDPTIALSMSNVFPDNCYIHTNNGINSTFTQLSSNYFHRCLGDINFLGDDIVYKGFDSYLHIYSGGDPYVHSWPLDANGQKFSVRSLPGSITTTHIDDNQVFVVDQNGRIYTAYRIDTYWVAAYLSQGLTNDYLVDDLSNIAFTNDNERKLIYKSKAGTLRYFEYVNGSWVNGALPVCGGIGTANVDGNITPGANNLLFYRNSMGQIRNTFWRCCEVLNECADANSPTGIIYRTEGEERVINDQSSPSESILISPNPTSERIRVKSCGFTQIQSLKIIDIFGNVHISIDKYRGEEIDVKRLSSGMYFVQPYLSENATPKLNKFIKI